MADERPRREMWAASCPCHRHRPELRGAHTARRHRRRAQGLNADRSSKIGAISGLTSHAQEHPPWPAPGLGRQTVAPSCGAIKAIRW
jgi:hypothetical protein